MSNNQSIPDVPPEMTGGAVSVYGGQDGLDDFPVLKAFQQYVDAEQAKARKRMVQLCIFFAILMAVVIGVFVALVMDVSRRNQELNDRLVKYAMEDRAAQPAVPASVAGADTAIKAMTESMAAFQKQMVDQQTRLAEQQMKLAEQAVKNAAAAAEARIQAVQQPAQPPQPAQPSKADLAAEAKRKADAEMMARAQQKLKDEREALAREKEALRLQEIEIQRRRLYPELYDANGNLLPPKPAKVQRPIRIADVAKPAVQEEMPEEDEDDLSEIDAAIAKESDKLEKSDELIEGGAINYFDYEDEEPEEKPVKKASPKAKPKPSTGSKAGVNATAKPKADAKPAPAAKNFESQSGWRIPLD